MVRVYIRTYVGEFDTLSDADGYLHKAGYNFDEDVQPVFEEVEDEEEDN
jgi:hypothetical protein